MQKKIQKNDMVNVQITDMGEAGEGIGKVEGYTLFIKDAVIGDFVEAKVIKANKNYGYGKLIQILNPSAHRVQPRCPVARQCGGCQLQSLSYEEQIRFKQNKIQNNLERIGGFQNLSYEPILEMDDPYHYRNKAQFPIGRAKDGSLIAGFYAEHTHDIIHNLDCCLLKPVNAEILKIILSYMDHYNIEPYNEKTGKGLVRHVLIKVGFFSGEIMVCIVANGGKKKFAQLDQLIRQLQTIQGMKSILLNQNTDQTNVVLGKKLDVLWGTPFITDTIGNIQFQISPLSFYQVNPVQTEKLYNTALEFASLTGKETVWDLYCGIGTISLFLAKKAKKVYGVEMIEDAIQDARVNATINAIQNVEFFVGKAEQVLPQKYSKEGVKADVIVLDPPRKGCDQILLDVIIKMQPSRIVYISCNSSTLARDLKYLGEREYKVQRVRGCDMFGMTGHVETAVLLVRKG